MTLTPDSLEAHIARLPIESVRRNYHTLLLDTSEDETTIERLAKRVLDSAWVDGTSFGVPGPTEIVARLVEEIETLRSRS